MKLSRRNNWTSRNCSWWETSGRFLYRSGKFKRKWKMYFFYSSSMSASGWRGLASSPGQWPKNGSINTSQAPASTNELTDSSDSLLLKHYSLLVYWNKAVLIHRNNLLENKINIYQAKDRYVGGTVASWLVGSFLERAVRVRALTSAVVFLGKTLNSHSASLHPGV